MATYNVNKIENWYDDFISCKNKFTNTYYADYKSSYIRTCNDSIINKMESKLNSHYNKINRIYTRINTFWKDFLDDLINTDLCLAGTKKSGSVQASAVSSKLSKLPTLKEYKNSFDVTVAYVNASLGTEKVLQFFRELTWEHAGATIATLDISLVEGVVNLAEAAVDLSVIVGAVITSEYTIVIDAVNAVIANYTGDESLKTNYTKELWEITRAFVATDYSTSIFDSFYENTIAGQWIKENAVGFDVVRNIGCEVGEVAAVVILSAVTGGSAAVIYGAAKAAEHTEKNWQDENTSTAGGFFKGILQGTGDGVFFALGSKGDKLAQSAAKKVVDSGSKTILKKTGILGGKMIFEGGCSIAQDCSNILINTVFSNDSINGETIKFNNFTEKWDYYYNEAGGTKGLMTSVATASIMSGLSDSFDIYKVKGTNTVVKNADIDMNSLGDIINARVASKNMDDLSLNKTYFDNSDFFQKRGISYEQYAANNGIQLINYSNEFDLATDLGDENWYLVNVLKNNTQNMTPQQYSMVCSAIEKPRCDLDSQELFNLASPYLNNNDIINLNKIAKNPNMQNLTVQERHTLFQFQHAGGVK